MTYNLTVNKKTDINPMGFTYTPTEFHFWVSSVAKVIKKTFEPIGLDNVVLDFFNYRVDSRSNSNIDEEFQCLCLLYKISETVKDKYDFDDMVDITLSPEGQTLLEFPREDSVHGCNLVCEVYDMVDALHLFKMLQIALPTIQINYSIGNELNEECCRPFNKPYQTNGVLCFDL